MLMLQYTRATTVTVETAHIKLDDGGSFRRHRMGKESNYNKNKNILHFLNCNNVTQMMKLSLL